MLQWISGIFNSIGRICKNKGVQKSKLKSTLGETYEDELLEFAVSNAASIVQLASLDLDSVGNDVADLQKNHWLTLKLSIITTRRV